MEKGARSLAIQGKSKIHESRRAVSIGWYSQRKNAKQVDGRASEIKLDRYGKIDEAGVVAVELIRHKRRSSCTIGRIVGAVIVVASSDH